MLNKRKDLCGIYAIEAMVGNPSKIGWKYIGKSEKCYARGITHFNELRRKVHDNSKLQYYYNKYGRNSLNFYVLFYCKENELNFWEKWWIKSLDSRENGFNILEGGESTPDTSKKCVLKNINTGEVVSCNSITEFALKYNLFPNSISDVLSGKNNYVKGWYNPEGDWKPTITSYEVVDPDGMKHNFTSIKQFCTGHGIKNIRNFREVMKGNRLSANGWSLSGTIKKPNHISKYNIISPDGKVFEGENISELARKFSLNPSGLNRLVRGERNSYKGWKTFKDK